MRGQFQIKIGAHPKDSEISIDGHVLQYVRGFTVVSDLKDNDVSRVNIEMLAINPFVMNGEGEITINAVVVTEATARAVYESLKKIFESK